MTSRCRLVTFLRSVAGEYSRTEGSACASLLAEALLSCSSWRSSRSLVCSVAGCALSSPGRNATAAAACCCVHPSASASACSRASTAEGPHSSSRGWVIRAPGSRWADRLRAC
jgi:hypothetical protein